MIKITITTKDNLNPWLVFATQDEVDSYVADITNSEHWGKNAYTEIVSTAIPEVLDEAGNVLTPAVSEVSIQHSAEWSYVLTDVTEEISLQEATKQALQNQQTGSVIIATIAAINDKKLESKSMSQQTFNALLADQNVLNIERLLWNGSLITAKALIQTVDLNAYYTSDEINSILALLP